ncbi:SURF1 family protein [Rhodovarius crocodyli]|uniref:SURF1-like protein n=1 Tax=Rhodovarius crocodyli TaxID=1979269 RepID=A0A437MHE2_9PROT|nr:SURF1 family protein [Rhodovarius crocodyli]
MSSPEDRKGGPQAPLLHWGRIILPSFAALPMLAVLLGLGIWQMQRLAWKEGILAQLAAAQAAPAAPAGTTAEPFTHIAATGRFRHDLEILLGAEVRGTVLGADLVTVLERDGLPPLLVDRGWVPQTLEGVERPQGTVTVTGWSRPSERPGMLSATDSPAQRRFFNFDIPAMGGALGVQPAPYGLVVVGQGAARPRGVLGAGPAAHQGAVPDPARGFPQPDNPHLGYAITWFSLAFIWCVVFGVWCWKRVRAP